MLIQHSLYNIILSSVPNYVEISGLTENTPSKITFSGVSTDVVQFTLTNLDFTKTWYGYSIATLSDTTFPTSLNSLIALYECLKLNTSIFTEINLDLNTSSITCNIGSGFDLQPGAAGVTINLVTNPVSVNKTVVLIGNNIELSKYHYTTSIKFNLSDPFDNITFFEPRTYALNSYTINNGLITINPIISTISILPTTLSRYEWVDYDDYLFTSGDLSLKNILTNREESNYNYDEQILLSILLNSLLSGISLNVKYYTNSGVFINNEFPVLTTSYKVPRYDILFTPNLTATEIQYNNEIGYFTVEVMQNSDYKSKPLKFIVNPKCNTNNVFYFVNKLGGIDSFNFLRENTMKSSISDQVTYIKNNVEYNDINELEYVHSKRYDTKYTAETTLLDGKQAEYIVELLKSKYVYKYVAMHKTIIIIDKLDVNLDNLNNQGYNISVEYHYSDNKA